MISSGSVRELKQFWERKSQKELISFSVKRVQISESTVHEVELNCSCCKSTFVLRAAHDCFSNDNEEGLEWMKDSLTGDIINIRV